MGLSSVNKMAMKIFIFLLFFVILTTNAASLPKGDDENTTLKPQVLSSNASLSKNNIQESLNIESNESTESSVEQTETNLSTESDEILLPSTEEPVSVESEDPTTEIPARETMEPSEATLSTEAAPNTGVEDAITSSVAPVITIKPREIVVTTTATTTTTTSTTSAPAKTPAPPPTDPSTSKQTTLKSTTTKANQPSTAEVEAEIQSTKTTTSAVMTSTTHRPIITATSVVKPNVSNKSATHLALTMFFLVLVTALSFGGVWYVRRRRRLEQLRHQLMPQYNFDPTDDQDDWENQLIDEESSLRPRDKVQLYSYQRQQ